MNASAPRLFGVFAAAFTVPADLDWSRPTSDSYASAEVAPSGRFADFRRALDYSWHRCPSPSRTELQDALLDEILASGSASPRPWVVFMAGAMGAGKSHVIQLLERREGLFPHGQFVVIDPDEIKAALPEMEGLRARDTKTAGTLTHRESAQIAELAQAIALRRGVHTLVDGSLRDGAWYRQVFEGIRRDFPTYRIGIVHVHASESTVMERVARRARETGRNVPVELIRDSLVRVPGSVALLTPFADLVININNEASLPTPMDPVESWSEFAHIWDAVRGSAEENAAAAAAGAALDDEVRRLLGADRAGDHSAAEAPDAVGESAPGGGGPLLTSSPGEERSADGSAVPIEVVAGGGGP